MFAARVARRRRERRAVTVGWLDAQAGASGDMLLGALVDAGVPLEVLQAAVDAARARPAAQRRADDARRSRGHAHPRPRRGPTRRRRLDLAGGPRSATSSDPQRSPQPHRSWADVRALLGRLEHPQHALEVFRRLAEAEAAVHGTSPDEVTFHEVGALDALADVVGVCAGFRHLGLERLVCSPVSLGSGTARGAHGPLPVPVPAVLRLLDGAPVQAGPAPFESTTPTGAALLATLVGSWGPLPPMQLGRTGAGAGSRDSDAVCNAVRLVLGTGPGLRPWEPQIDVIARINVRRAWLAADISGRRQIQVSAYRRHAPVR